MPEFKDRNDGSRALINVDSVQAAPYFLSGDGLNLGMWDGGRVYSHDGFAGRLVIKNNVSVSNHATHVAGTMAGNGANSNNHYLRGMDTLAYIYSWTYQGKTWDQIATEMKNAVTQDNIVLSQNSWGDIGGGGLYTVGARLMDQVVREKDISVIFAVGYGGHVYNSMWSPETGKNLISVTATTKTGEEYFDASSGPCKDGRLKPDISAAGVDIQSTWPDNGYDYLTGTSMAAPAISGVIGLMIERYKNRNNGQLPSASLLKAILLNTATDIGTAGPDYFYGYGIANALEAIRTIDAGNFLTDEISQGATQNYLLTVPAGIDHIRVLLAYTDREASVNANPALVNDLDLKLISPNNTEYLPLTLDPANPSAPAQPAVNHRDNVEQVVVNNPLAGNWTVQISAPSVPFGPQEFTVTWKLPTIRVRVDQKLADGQTIVDSIGRWEGGPNFVLYEAPHTFTFEVSTTEVLRGAQKVISNQKYHKWSIDDTVLNHRAFNITWDFPDELTSEFYPTKPGIVLKNAFLSAPPGSDPSGDVIAFKDPWLIDSTDAAHGNNPLNRGMQAIFRTQESPFNPDYTNPHNGYVYQGVFLNQPYTGNNPVFYSVRAVDNQQVTVNGKSITYDWESWSYDPDS
ncbi:MAG: hypothetical protein D6748_09010, partial [Calditrichaeota bacterium]